MISARATSAVLVISTNCKNSQRPGGIGWTSSQSTGCLLWRDSHYETQDSVEAKTFPFSRQMESSSTARIESGGKVQQGRSTSGVRNFLAGGFGGVCGVTIGHPFDTIKVSITYTYGLQWLFVFNCLFTGLLPFFGDQYLVPAHFNKRSKLIMIVVFRLRVMSIWDSIFNKILIVLVCSVGGTMYTRLKKRYHWTMRLNGKTTISCLS